MRSEFEALDRPDAVLMPRGLAFHVPPANVDTIFVYSLALALITGNSSIVRMSSRVLAEPNLVLDVLLETLPDHPAGRRAGSCDHVRPRRPDHRAAVRCLRRAGHLGWGRHHRADPSAPPCTHTPATSRSPTGSPWPRSPPPPTEPSTRRRDALVERFFNDTYWFDQMGCSSPRSLVWVGTDAAHADGGRLPRTTAGGRHPQGLRPGCRGRDRQAQPRLPQHHRHADRLLPPVRQCRHSAGDPRLPRRRAASSAAVGCCTSGMFEQLADLAPHIRRQDQTLGVFGIAEDQIRELVAALAGRGIDRIVPIGRALDFGRFWDGYDLYAEFTRRVAIDVGRTNVSRDGDVVIIGAGGFGLEVLTMRARRATRMATRCRRFHR